MTLEATIPSAINWRLLIPLLLCAGLLQITVPMARVATSYVAMEMALPTSSLGLLSSAFALLPVILAISIGRYNDRRGEGRAASLGAVLILVAVLGLELAAFNLPLLLLFTSLLGLGQLLLVAALQMATTRCSDATRHDAVLGHFLVATSVGQAVGPLLIPLTTPAGSATPGAALTWVLMGMAAILVAATFTLVRGLPTHSAHPDHASLPIRGLLAVPGLFIIILASSLTVTANDLMLVYFPAVGAARGIDAALVGLLLSVRAAASISSRVLFARLAAALGKPVLLTIALSLGGLATVGLLIDLPVPVIGILLCLSGFSAGLATAASISLALAVAPPGMRATTVTLRLTANRVAQFVLPLAAGSTTVILGAASVFAFIGASMLASGVSTVRAWRVESR